MAAGGQGRARDYSVLAYRQTRARLLQLVELYSMNLDELEGHAVAVRPRTNAHLSWALTKQGYLVIQVPIEKFEYLPGLHFTWTKIAQLLGISRSTLYRHLKQEGTHATGTYAHSNNDLDRIGESIKQSNCNDGERLLIGHLHQRAIGVP